jgi:hypothetical protein
MLVIEMHEVLEHVHESDTLARLERRQNQPLRGGNRGIDIPDHAVAGRCDLQGFGAAVG